MLRINSTTLLLLRAALGLKAVAIPDTSLAALVHGLRGQSSTAIGDAVIGCRVG